MSSADYVILNDKLPFQSLIFLVGLTFRFVGQYPDKPGQFLYTLFDGNVKIHHIHLIFKPFIHDLGRKQAAPINTLESLLWKEWEVEYLNCLIFSKRDREMPYIIRHRQ